MSNHLKQWLSVAFILLIGLSSAHAVNTPEYLPEDKNTLKIFSYSNVDDETDETALSTQEFQNHIEEILKLKHYLVSLDEFANTLPLQPFGRAITIDASNASMTNALPILLKAKIPFTIIYPFDEINHQSPNFTNWKTLKSLSKNKNISFAVMPPSLLGLDDTQMLRILNKTRLRHRQVFNNEANIIFYPDGIATSEIKKRVKAQGFKIALTKNVGVAYENSDVFALPIFAINKGYADIDRFFYIQNALPLPVTEVTPADNFESNEPYYLGFTLPSALSKRAEELSCTITGSAKPTIQVIGNRIEIRSPEDLTQSRIIRTTCTMPELRIPMKGWITEHWRWVGFTHYRMIENQ